MSDISKCDGEDCDRIEGKKMKQTTLINIYGAPGSGKSTLAAELYAYMKQNGYSVELVREEIKDWAWQGKKPTVFEQIYITNKQMLTESNLYGKVEYVITDSPILLGDFYCRYYHNSEALFNLDHKILYEGFKLGIINQPISFFIPIEKQIFNNEGRYSSLDESLKIELELLEFLNKYFLGFIKLNNLNDRCKDIVKYINIQYGNNKI